MDVQTPAPPTRPSDLIPVTEACRLIPSRQRGKSLDVATLYRWVERGFLRGWSFRPPGARKGALFVSRADVEALLVQVVPRRPVVHADDVLAAGRAERLRQADAALDAAGI